MKIGLVGLGKMGYSLAQNMAKSNHEVIGYDAYVPKMKMVKTVTSIEKLVESLPTPRVIWLMVPAGEITEALINQLAELLDREDIIIDGGNAFYKDSIRRHGYLKE